MLLSDSQLVVQQIKGDYVAKVEKMVAYLDRLMTIKEKLYTFEVRQCHTPNFDARVLIKKRKSTCDLTGNRQL